MKSIQTKFILLFLGCIFLSFGIIGGAGIMHAERTADMESAKNMNLVCAERAQEIDALLSRIRQSAQTLAAYATTQLESLDRLKNDPAYLEEYTKRMESVAVNTVCNTEGAMAVYVRFNPEFITPTSGLFWSKTPFESNFRQHPPADFFGVSPEDTEREGWCSIPVKNGNPTWMAPYFDKNINVSMISYVIPLYMSDQVIGVVGMDIDLFVITSIVDNMSLYTSGYAFLTDSFAAKVHHKSMEKNIPIDDLIEAIRQFTEELRLGSSAERLFPFTWHGQEKRMAFRPLSNGMRLVVTAPATEIDAEKDALLRQVGIALLVTAILAATLAIVLTRRFIRPLRELADAAQKLAAGDLSVCLTQQTRDEVGTLAESFQQTMERLQNDINYINILAYRDSMTGVKNKTAFQESEKRLEEQMRCGRPEFALIMLDVNGLKKVNDTYGHDVGDMFIINACRIICKTFQHSPVFRIGGDEFVVILEQMDYRAYPKLFIKLQTNIDLHNQSARSGMQIYIARGLAVYDHDTDIAFANVFKRADDAMYKNKADMKSKEQ